MDYAVEVRRQPARVVDREGQSLQVEFFLHTVSASGGGPERLGERLNDPAVRFLPCAVGDHTELIGLDRLAFVELAETPPEIAAMRETGAREEDLLLRLVTGEAVRGRLVYEAPPGQARISDLVNSPATRFLALVTSSGLRWVHRRAVVRIQL